MNFRQTLEEPESQGSRTTTLLTLVLRYDDLTTTCTETAAIADDVNVVSFGRAEPSVSKVFLDGSTVAVPGPWASARHATLERMGTSWVLRDLGSRNGTYVGTQRVNERRIDSGDLFEVGHCLFCLRTVDEREARLVLGPRPRLGPTETACPSIAKLVMNLNRIAPTNQSVLLLGETGVGKEIVGGALHELSKRSGAYRKIDCGAVPETLFEATLFGHRRGAYTGAHQDERGELERSDGGTLLLDEVGNTSAAVQAKLLRVIEEGRVTPVGSHDARPVDVRWIAATNSDLVNSSNFRPDLYRRLAGFVGHIAPLRERREDLGLLAAHILKTAGAPTTAFTGPAARVFFMGQFPGNIRELRANLASSAYLADGHPIDLDHLPRQKNEEARPAPLSPPISLAPAALRHRNNRPGRDTVEAALSTTHGNVVRAAAMLATHPRQLYRWLERYGIDRESFRSN